MNLILSIAVVASAGLMVHPSTLLVGQLLLILTVFLLVPGSTQREFSSALAVIAICTVAITAAATSAKLRGLSNHDTAQTIRYLLIPSSWLLAGILGWRRLKPALWSAAVIHGMGHLAVAVMTAKFSPVYWDVDLGLIGGESRIFQKLLDAPNVVYAPSLSSEAMAATIAGATFFLSRNAFVRFLSLSMTVAFLVVSGWLGNKASTLSVAGCWAVAYFLSSRGAGSFIVKLACATIAAVVLWAAFSERLADSGRMARLSDQFDTTFTGRTSIWNDAVQDISKYPCGVTLELARDEIGMTEHNTPLQMIRVFGWIPGTAFLLLLAYLCLSTLRMFPRHPMLPFIIASAGPCLAICAVESLLIGSSGALYALFAVTGILIQHEKNHNPVVQRKSTGPRPDNRPARQSTSHLLLLP